MEDLELRERLNRIEAKITVLTAANKVSVQNDEKSTGENFQNLKKIVPKDRISELLDYVEEKRSETKDPLFEQYLNVMEGNLLKQQTQIDEIARNLEKNYQQYKKNIELAERNKVAQMNVTVSEDLQSDIPVSKELQSDIPVSKELQTNLSVNSELHAKPDSNVLESNIQVSNVQVSDVPFSDVSVSGNSKQSDLISSDKPFNTSAKKVDTSKKKPDIEYKIGTVLLSVVGALFIISAFVIFGLNYMNNLAQGILLYVLAGVIITFSEIIVRRNIEKFAQAVTGLGICILYTATILNYLYLHTITGVIAIILTLSVSGFTLLLSRKRESSLLRLIGILGCYISFAPLNEFESSIEFVIPCVMVVIVNILYIALPIQKEWTYVSVVHAVANVAFSVYVVTIALISEINLIPGFIFTLVMMISIYAIFWKVKLKELFAVTFVMSLIILTFIEARIMYENEFYYAATAIFAVVIALCIYFYRERNMCWVGLYCFSVFVLSIYSIETNEILLATAALLAIYKVLSFREELKYANIVASSISLVIYLLNVKSETNMQYAILAVFVLSVISLKYYKTLHEVLIWVVLEGFAVFSFDSYIAVPLSVAFILLCLVLFETVDRFRDHYFKVFAYIALAFNVIILACASILDNPISLTLLLVLQIIVIFFIFSQKHGMKPENVNKARLISLAIFLTYMIFIFKIEIPIVTSILLMLLAIACVGAGFVWKQKCIRIYGLILALFVCVKILLIDFQGMASQDRIILFFVVGVIALAISYIYMRIERSLSMKEKL